MKVAIVGSGPSGFYAAESLLNAEPNFSVDMFEKLPVPFGLVRSGVAPDHPKLKSVISQYEEVALRQGFRFFGNVNVGEDISIDDLSQAYSAVIIATGAQADRALGIPGEGLIGSHSARSFVNWYNGHPDFRHETFDLSSEAAVIVGMGNVAMDVCRILLKSVDELRKTDIAVHALDALEKSKVRTVHIVGRRGPAQMKISHKELREIAALPQCALTVADNGLELNEASIVELDHRTNRENSFNLKLLKETCGSAPIKSRGTCVLHYLKQPTRILGETKVRGVEFGINILEGEPHSQSIVETSKRSTILSGLIFRSVGYKGVPVPGVDFDETHHCISHTKGRVEQGLYCTGWIKRGPSGVIGTNRADSIETVESLLEDLPNLKNTNEDAVKILLRKLEGRVSKIVTYSDWQIIDSVEKALGKKYSKPRQKLVTVEEMLQC